MHQTERIRQLIRATFLDLGAADVVEPDETLLIRNGYYCGRRFTCNGLQAVWFIEENQVKFYGHDGAVVRVCQALAEYETSVSHVA